MWHIFLSWYLIHIFFLLYSWNSQVSFYYNIAATGKVSFSISFRADLLADLSFLHLRMSCYPLLHLWWIFSLDIGILVGEFFYLKNIPLYFVLHHFWCEIFSYLNCFSPSISCAVLFFQKIFLKKKKFSTILLCFQECSLNLSCWDSLSYLNI